MLMLTPDTSLLLHHAVELMLSTHSHLYMVLDICDLLYFCLFVAGDRLALLVPFYLLVWQRFSQAGPSRLIGLLYCS